ncbi:MAG: GNAT family N-acetyltransferase [Marmoricola sp.]
MSRQVSRLTVDDLALLPDRCGSCVFWELDPVSRAAACGRERAEKAAWVAGVLHDWGSCGQIVTIDDEYAGHILWAPPVYVPAAAGFATAPVSADAVLLVAAHVDPRFREAGLGRILVQAMVRDLIRKGEFRAVEAFGDLRGTEGDCILPADFLLSLGFATHRPHERYPRLRMDLRSVVTWRSEFEAAIERLLKPARRGKPSPAVRTAQAHPAERTGMNGVS